MPQQGILLEDQHFEMCPWALGHSASGLGRFANPLVQSDLKVETQQATNTFIFPSSPNTLLATVHRHHFHCMCCTQFVPINTAAASPALSTLAVIARDLNLRLSASDDHFLLTNIAICALRRHHQEVEVVLWDGIIARLRLLNIQARILTTWRHTTGDAHLEHSLSFTRWRLQEMYVGTLGDWLSFHTDRFALPLASFSGRVFLSSLDGSVASLSGLDLFVIPLVVREAGSFFTLFKGKGLVWGLVLRVGSFVLPVVFFCALPYSLLRKQPGQNIFEEQCFG